MPQTPWIPASVLAPLAPNLLFQKGEFERARSGYRALHCYEGELHALLRLDRWQEALTVGEKVTAPTPEGEGLLALAYLRSGQPQRAQQSAEWAAPRDSSAYWPLVALGAVALRWKASRDEAHGHFLRATQQRPELAEGWLGLLAVAATPEEAQQVVAALARLAPRGYPFDFWSQPLRLSVQNQPFVSRAFPEGGMFCPQTPLPPVQTLSFKRDPRGMLYFDALIEGQPMRLLYDTGGGHHCMLTSQALARLQPAFVASTVLTGIQGQSAGQLYRGERLQIGELELRRLLIESAPGNLGGFDGLVGWRVLGERVQRIDLRQNTLTLLEKPAFREGPGISLPLHFVADQPVIGVRCRRWGRVGEVALWAILDTGATQDFFSLRAGAQLSARFRRDRLQTTMGIGQSHKQIERRTLSVGYELLTPESRFLASYSEATAASFLDKVHNPATGFEHGLLLGMNFLSHFSVIELDPLGRRVRLVPL